ncbi:DUF1353 domain-containing protein [Nocardioides marmoriginsengisoli]|uniref:DUF1353 domain-containing protein n=1 Tax=Nocardioides marmoriginsengisoli TaxID=661483 RepID=A0A3N0CCZ4_9ACTN|nr:DUF1353 domain-containing protein [Nocardioides marmoriginsengisoli]RNL61322.1 DUF1353 domain-containing protein [Nocardioides marmoriginsengisoli]
MTMSVEVEPRRFYDGGVDGFADQPEIPPNPESDPQIELVRITTAEGGEEFAMMRRIGYRDRHLGEILVPRATESFRTDLTSVPALFTWLVPKTGRHLPAALVHDGLVHPPDDVTYVSTEGHLVLRAEADRVLRDAMADTGTGVVRRWLVWSAVTTATMLSGAGTGWSRRQLLHYRGAALLTLGVVVVLGFLATMDLLDVTWFWALPWMDDRDWYVELAGGLAGAVALPLALGLLWGRFRIAGCVVGVSLAVLLHVTVVLGGLSAFYQVLERAAAKAPRLAVLAAVVVAGVAVGFFLGLAF